MKQFMKKGLILTLILVCIASIFALSACGYQTHKGDKAVTLIVGEGAEQEIFSNYHTDTENLYDMLMEFNDEEYLNVVASDGQWGKFLTEVGSLKPDTSKNEYICILSSIPEQQDQTDYKITKLYKDTEVISTITGCSTLAIIDGGIYMIAIASF
ncbi:MAG: hypothetical protein WCR54_06460 [Clostridia bacterium]